MKEQQESKPKKPNILVRLIALLVTAALLAFAYYAKPRQKAQLSYRDAFLIGVAQAVAALRRAAEENGIAYQDEVLTAGGTDSAAMQQSKAGVLAGCISIPCRYIHSPNEMVSLQDVEQCARLMALAAGQAL